MRKNEVIHHFLILKTVNDSERYNILLFYIILRNYLPLKKSLYYLVLLPIPTSNNWSFNTKINQCYKYQQINVIVKHFVNTKVYFLKCYNGKPQDLYFSTRQEIF